MARLGRGEMRADRPSGEDITEALCDAGEPEHGIDPQQEYLRHRASISTAP